MKRTVISLVAFFALSSGIIAQSSDPVLMNINGKPVLKSEFEYIYNKNNSNNSLDKKTLEEYVDLFVNFKLKVEEAKTQGIDTTKSFISELSGYRSQLTKPYLTDSKMDEATIREAYDRSKEDVDVSHILIRIPQNATPADTLKAWNDINAVWKRVQKEDFNKVAKETSQDQSVEQNQGHISWISAFRTVYPFETVAYNTPVGTISKPVRTAFGYHVLKVLGRRNSLGEVQVAHIMTFTSKGEEAVNKKAKAAIDSIYQRIQAGDDFGALAAKHSMDKGSSVKNGELPWFGTGRMVPEFENAAFALKNKGDVSEPIQSAYGWHIIKLIDKKPLASYDELKADLERKVKRDERANRGQEAFLAKSKTENNYQLNAANLKEFYKVLGTKKLADSAFVADVAKLDKPLFSVAGKKYTQADFAKYLKKNNTSDKTIASEIINEKLDAYVSAELLAYEDGQLEKKYDDFRNLMQEYHDGILLFDLTDKMVWTKAVSDSAGLVKFHDANNTKYMWKERLKVYTYSCLSDKAKKEAMSMVSKGKSVDEIKAKLNKKIGGTIVVTDQKTEKGEMPTIDKLWDKKGVVDIANENNTFKFYVVDGVVAPEPKSLKEAKGLVTSDYQNYLEKEWIKSLREKYPVKVNEETVKTLFK